MELQPCIVFISLFIVYYTSAQNFQMPDPFLQARNGRGFRAYLPDSCGVENFEFQALTNRSDDGWTGGNVTKPQNGHWTFEAPDLSLAPGDRLKYRANVKHLGRQYRHPDSEWIVPEELEDEFNPPPFDKRQQCRDRKVPPIPNERDEPFPKPGFKSPCPWADVPRPNDPREIVLEKQLIGLQCEMNAHMDRSARIQYQLTQELTDLKKLNYQQVARMQRLESLIRNLPSRASSPSYPTPSYPFI